MNTRPSATPDPDAGRHTISVVADRTGLSRDVLRVWERRYQAVEPLRSAGGQRLYSDEQLERFQLLAAATRLGRSIGSIASLSTSELARLVADDVAATSNSANEALALSASTADSAYIAVAALALEHARRLDATSLDRELRRSVGQHGLPAFLEVIVPTLMYRIGDEWAAGTLAIPHEHLASGIVLAILLEAVRAIPETPDAPRLLVATPSGEQHVVGAAMIAAAAALDGWNILFLGADVPAADLVMAASGVRAIALSVVHAHDPAQTQREIQGTRATLPSHIPIIAGGAAAVRLRKDLELPGVAICQSIAEARGVLAKIARGHF